MVRQPGSRLDHLDYAMVDEIYALDRFLLSLYEGAGL